jgi:hypothetical protein
MKSLISQLNIRLILIHLAAFWLFFFAFHTLAFLHDNAFFNPVLYQVNRVTFPDRFNADITFIEQAANIGLVLAYIISWFICLKKGWHWINGVIIFVIAFILGNKNWFGWQLVNKVFLTPGRIFHDGSLLIYWTDGLIMLLLGSLLLFLNPVKRFIDRGSAEQKKVDTKKTRAR